MLVYVATVCICVSQLIGDILPSQNFWGNNNLLQDK